MPGARQHRDVAALGTMGILTEEELRHPELYTELYRRKSDAMERDLMHVQAAVHELLRSHRQKQEAMHTIATQTDIIAQALSRPEFQGRKDISAFLTRCQRVHEEAADLARPAVDKLKEVMPPASQANGEPGEPQAMSRSSRRRHRNRKREAGQNTKSVASTA
mmetsp:Transcript_110465/g.213948  ORF Transcript_110465/g.213948 Transcript_110465/m.213948 type:complete len:163 (+) Transcript_110465:2-490(+)